MKTADFIHGYVDCQALITIADINGNILYEGTPIWCPFGIIENTEVDVVSVGERKDILITIFKGEQQ